MFDGIFARVNVMERRIRETDRRDVASLFLEDHMIRQLGILPCAVSQRLILPARRSDKQHAGLVINVSIVGLHIFAEIFKQIVGERWEPLRLANENQIVSIVLVTAGLVDVDIEGNLSGFFGPVPEVGFSTGNFRYPPEANGVFRRRQHTLFDERQ